MQTTTKHFWARSREQKPERQTEKRKTERNTGDHILSKL